jgi:membrane associated rhomboid family serine protease
VVTLVVATLVALCNLAQVFWPQIVPALWRDPKALASGQVWRLVSPLLVQSDGLVAFITVFAGLLLVGIVVERLYGHLHWIILFFVGGLAGEIAGYAWQPYSSGTSVGVLGLVGGLVALAVWRSDVVARFERANLLVMLALVYSVAIVAGLVGGDLGNAALAGALPAVAAGVFIFLGQRRVSPRVVAFYVLGIMLAGVILLTFFRDIHGPALLAGLVGGSLFALLGDRQLATHPA